MEFRKEIESFFQELRDRIILAIEELDESRFERSSWKREGGGGRSGFPHEGENLRKGWR